MNAPFSYAPRREAMRIAGKLVTTDDVIEVRNPYDGSLVGTVPAARPEHVREAFATAKAFKPKLSRYQRQQILQKTAELLRDRKEDFARLISAESGLCWKDATLRIEPCLRCLVVRRPAFRSTMMAKSYACDISPNGKARRIHTLRTPLLGVISAITPFNHPLNMVSHKLAPAIATNNRVVLKPTELTPLTALALADVLYEAGLPPEMLSVVTGNPSHHGRFHDHRPGRRPRHLHGLGARRQAHRGNGWLQACRPRAWRQRSADRDGGCRSRQGGRTRCPGRDQELRPALHGGEADPRRRKPSRTSSAGSCWRRQGS